MVKKKMHVKVFDQGLSTLLINLVVMNIRDDIKTLMASCVCAADMIAVWGKSSSLKC